MEDRRNVSQYGGGQGVRKIWMSIRERKWWLKGWYERIRREGMKNFKGNKKKFWKGINEVRKGEN